MRRPRELDAEERAIMRDLARRKVRGGLAKTGARKRLWNLGLVQMERGCWVLTEAGQAKVEELPA